MPLFSIYFIAFLMVTVILYYSVPDRIQWVILLMASYVFYCLEGGWKGVIFILTTTITSYFAGILIEKEKENRRGFILVVCLLINFGILAALKYGNFIIDNVNALFANSGTGIYIDRPFFILPIGISFYTFQTMGYVIDVYRGSEKAEHNLIKHGLFVSFFPQIIQGPIARHEDLFPQLIEKHKWDDMRLREGILRMLWGFFKKIVLAERAGIIVNEVFANYADKEYCGFVIFIGGLLYGIQVYADFSGGMDIVFGSAEILGIKMTENFRQPYFARNVSEFWQRWHITLGGWMKQYVFYPLCLTEAATVLQKKTRKILGPYYGKVIVPTVASFFTFILVGIWHGAEWKYVAYGIYTAILVSSHTLCDRWYASLRGFFRINADSTEWKAFQIIRTTFLVLIGRFFSRGNGIKDAVAMIKAMFSSFNPWVFSDDTLLSLGLDYKNIEILIFCIVILFVVDHINEKGTKVRSIIAVKPLLVRWTVYYASAVIVLLFGIYGGTYNVSSFIYQQF